MRINNLNISNKNINKKGIIYALIFVIYIIIAALIFGYTIKFLRNNINTALSTPENTEIENKYGQLDLASYSLLANKLGLIKNNPTPEEVTNTVTEDLASSTEPDLTNEDNQISTTTDVVEPVNNVIITPEPVIEARPTIAVNNSTIKSGLAASLKNKLIAANYQVLSVGNIKPTIKSTTIKIKNNINPDSKYLAEIKKIVDIDYDFIISELDSKAKTDIEIIIGTK